MARLAASSASAGAAARSASVSGEYQRQNLARNAEQTLGTEKYNELGFGVPSIGGQNNVPFYPGTIEIDRQNNVLSLASEIRDYGEPASLNNLMNTYI